MKYNEEKVDEMTLALLYLVTWRSKGEDGERAWKGFAWETMDRLHQKGWISDPKGKAKSVVMSKKGLKKAEELFRRHFGLAEE